MLVAAGAFGLLAVGAGILGFEGAAGALGAAMLVCILLAPWATR
ncbi:MAG TPA: hypothetical protein VGR37_07150 [Longimicrobiaceae bacterium]|nr:hypothetical protein [Longimicrobiaceae bacterium]